MSVIPDKAVIVNHSVWRAGGSSGKAATAANVAHSVDYLSREGDFEVKGGCDREVTRADRDLSRLYEQVDYRGRVGDYEGRNPELPMKEGEVSGGCWGPRGLVDDRALAREIAASGSSYITSVVSVSREHAAELGLTCKADFQKLARSTWDGTVASWGIIAREDVRWAAWFHTDNPKNVHIHIITWDASGSFKGDAVIPHGALVESNVELRRAAFSRVSLATEKEKGYLRDLTMAKLKMEIGQEGAARAIPGLELKREEAGIPTPPVPYGPSADPGAAEAAERARAAIVELLPATARGYVQFRSLPRHTRDAVLGVLRELAASSPDLRALERSYRESAEQLASARSLRRNERERYVNSQMFDYRARMANVLLRDAAAANRDIARDPVLRDRIAAAADTVGKEARAIAEGRGGRDMDDAIRRAMSRDDIKGEIGGIAAAMSGSGAAMPDRGRAERAVVRQVERCAERSLGIGMADRLADRSARTARIATRHEARRVAIIGPERSAAFDVERAVVRAHGGTRGYGGLDSKGRASLERAADHVVGCEKMKAMIAREASYAAAQNRTAFRDEYARALAEKREVVKDGIMASVADPGRAGVGLSALAALSMTMSSRKPAPLRSRMTDAEKIERGRSKERSPEVRQRGLGRSI